MTMILPELVEFNAEVAAQALDGAATQAAFAARFFARGDHAAGLAAYDRMANFVRGHAADSVRYIRDAEKAKEAIIAGS